VNTGAIMNGHLEWSIKLSLLLYVTSAPGGGIRAEGITSENGCFFFPLSEGGVGDGSYAFDGSIALFAHHGAPITTFASLRLRREASGSWVLEMSPDDGPAVPAFSLGAAREVEHELEFTDVTLTQIGSEMFGGYYVPGEKFDPIRVLLHRG